jgi:predicted glycosyltransferase
MNEHQQRILFFVHDGSGLGHLRRICHVADALQGPCASLVVTGHRSVSWMLTAGCEFVHLPSWDSIELSRSRYWNRTPWMIEESAARRCRAEMLSAAFEAFSPHAIVVDYHPFGRYGELRRILARSKARKYLLLRGVIDGADFDMLCGNASAEIAEVFDAIVVACDRGVIDVAASYDLVPRAARLLTYVGYITAPPRCDRGAVREAAGVPRDIPWIVCSAGGGKRGEGLIEECVDVAAAFPNVRFDAVLGPRSRLAIPTAVPSNCRVFAERRDLPEWHGACDVLVTPGGYNSLLEGAAGGARLLVRPMRNNRDSEPRDHASRLSAIYPVTIAADADALRTGVADCIRQMAYAPRPIFPYSMDGLQTLRNLLLMDR